MTAHHVPTVPTVPTFIEMKSKDIRPLKEKIWRQNDEMCPVLKKKIPLDKMALDHAHKRNDEEYADDKGVIRTALDFRVNVALGRLENALKRTGLAQDEDFNLPEFLRNAADYFEAGAYTDEFGNMYIHPKEVHKEPTVSKRNYNKLKKMYSGNKKFPEYPKSGKLTIGLKALFDEYKISPYN
jgi:hypothetical protein